MSADGGQITQSSSLVLYDQMCSAIIACVRVDEAKDIRDKALALEAYYRQARNLDAEREAANVRLRAERRVGELLKELERAPTASGGDIKSVSARATPIEPSPYATALAEHGMSRQSAHRFQALADVPKDTFERALRAPEKPTTAALLKHNEARAQVRDPAPTPRVSDAALTLWGQLRDFEREGLFTADCRSVLAQMTDGMRADVARLIPHVRDLLDCLENAIVPA